MNTTQVATKADVSAVRSELRSVRTELKSDIKALRQELKSEIKSLRQQILKLEERVDNLEEGQTRIVIILKRIESTLDGFVGRIDNQTTDNEVGAHHTRELQKRVDDHEDRLQQIESIKPSA